MIKVTKDNFESEVLKSDAPVLVEFWAGWCPYCRRLAPAIAQLEEKLSGTVKVCGINEDDDPELEDKYGVELIPTLILFRGGVPGEKLVAAKSLDEVERWLRAQGA